MSAPAPAVASVSGLVPSPGTRYRAFISYSHSDTKWARWLIRRLETYTVPKRFHGRAAPIGEVGKRIAPVFRDRDELPTTSDLGATIRAALRDAATLIVICSPRSAKSRWVEEEIKSFKRLHGERRVFAFIVAGEPKIEGAADDCFSPALRVEVGADGELSGELAEVVAADARPGGDGPKLAFVRLVAGLLGVGFDELRQRELQRRNRRLMVLAVSSAAGMTLTLGLAIAAWQARNDAQRRQDQAERVLAFMLGDFRDELKKIGRLPLLDKVGNEAMEYFESLDARDLTDTALARQAKALTQIGENQLEQAKFPAAAQAFMSAYRRAAALAARHPQDGDVLFERGQAEFWIGATHRRQANFSAAAEWLTRYRDTSRALVALDPGQTKWQLELVSGDHNLAVVQLDRGDLEAARAAFERKLATVIRMSAAAPGDAELVYRVANTESWLGTVAERRGDFAAALTHFEAEEAGHDANIVREPGTVRWRFQRADCLFLQVTMLGITGRVDQARARLRQARDILDDLVKHDPANRTWESMALLSRLREAAFEISAGRAAEVEKLVVSTRSAFEELAARSPSDRLVQVRWGQAWRIEAECRHALRRPDAYAAATRALELFETQPRDGANNLSTLVEFIRALVVAGCIAADNGHTEAAERHARRTLQLVEPWRHSNYWRMLDPAVRALALLRDADAAHALIRRLEGLGYRPLEPWPAPGGAAIDAR